jgi:putative methionine-R-sulfoxide reductase with GAF domain
MTKTQNKFNFKIWLYGLFFSFILLGAIVFMVFKTNNKRLNEQVEISMSLANRQTLIAQILKEVFFNAELFHQFNITASAQEQLYYRNRISQSFKEIENQMDSLRLAQKIEEEEILVRELFFNVQKIKDITLNYLTINTVPDNEKWEQYYLFLAKTKKVGDNLDNYYSRNFTAIDDFDLRENVEFILIILFFVLSLLTYFVLQNLIFNFRKSVEFLGIAFEKSLNEEVSELHMSQVYTDLNVIKDKILSTNLFFLEIREFIGNLVNGKLDDNRFSLRGDILSVELENLRLELISNKSEINKREAETRQRDWINSGLSKFNEILRLYSGNLQELSSELITSLVKYISAIQGGIFITNDENTEELDLFASFAFNRKKYLDKKIKFGDGLVGTAVTEKRTIYLTELPPDYLEISSGLGDTKPLALLIVPLLRDNQVFGVLEISSFNLFSAAQIEFVEKVADLTALTINTEKINHRTVRLLGESQRKSDELATQEEEMRQNLEELRATQEESKRREAELLNIIDAIENKLMQIIFSPDKRILSVNKKFMELTKINFSAVHEKYLQEMLSSDSVDSLNETWKSALEYKKSEVRFSFNFLKKDFYGILVPVFEHETGMLLQMRLFLSDVSLFTDIIQNLNSTVEHKKTLIDELIQHQDSLKIGWDKGIHQQKIILNLIFESWSKYMENMKLQVEKKSLIESDVSKLKEEKEKLTQLNNMLSNQIKQLLSEKYPMKDIDKKYKDWLDSL